MKESILWIRNFSVLVRRKNLLLISGSGSSAGCPGWAAGFGGSLRREIRSELYAFCVGRGAWQRGHQKFFHGSIFRVLSKR